MTYLDGALEGPGWGDAVEAREAMPARIVRKRLVADPFARVLDHCDCGRTVYRKPDESWTCVWCGHWNKR